MLLPELLVTTKPPVPSLTLMCCVTAESLIDVERQPALHAKELVGCVLQKSANRLLRPIVARRMSERPANGKGMGDDGSQSGRLHRSSVETPSSPVSAPLAASA